MIPKCGEDVANGLEEGDETFSDKQAKHENQQPNGDTLSGGDYGL